MCMPVVGSHFKVRFDNMISYLFLCLVGLGISLVWGNVEPHFVIIFGIKITYLSCQMLYEYLITLLSSFDCLNLTTLGFKTIQHCSIIRIQDFLEDIKNGQL